MGKNKGIRLKESIMILFGLCFMLCLNVCFIMVKFPSCIDSAFYAY